MDQKIKILAVFLLGMAITLICSWLLFNPDRMIEDLALKDLTHSKDMFDMSNERDIVFLSATLESIAQDEKLRDIFLEKDREKLFLYKQQFFRTLRNKYDVWQFNFVLPNGTVFVRMQSKELFNDILARASLELAQETNSVASGIEIGKTGYSLRVVVPYYNGSELIGYLELGKEIGQLIRFLKGKSSEEIAFFVDKKLMDKDSWAEMRVASGYRNNWNDLNNFVIASSTTEANSESCFTEENAMNANMGGGVYLQKIKSKDQESICGGFNVLDASGKQPIGSVLISRDIKKEKTLMQEFRYRLMGISSIMFIALFAALVFISGLLQKQSNSVAPDGGINTPSSDFRNLREKLNIIQKEILKRIGIVFKNRSLVVVIISIVLFAVLVGVLYYLNHDSLGKIFKPVDNTDTNGITDSEILIGSSAALSGHARLLGIRYLRGSMLYFNKINEEGGVNGRKIRIISYDDQYSPSITVANTQKLIQSDKVFLLFDYVGTPTGVKVLYMVNESKIPLFGLFTGAEEFRTPLQHYVFNVRASYYKETGAAVDYFVGKKGLSKIAVFYQDDAFGQTGLKGTEIALNRYGLVPVAKSTFARGTTDVGTGLEIIQISNPEAIIMIGTYTPLAKFVDLYRAQGYDPYFHTVSFVGAEAFADELTTYGINSSEKIIVTQVVPDPHEWSLEYVVLSGKYFPEDPLTYTGLEGYANAVLLVKALNDSGRDLNRKNFVKALESIHDYEVIGIPVIFGPNDHSAFDSSYLSYLDNKRFKIFEPK